MKEHFAGHLHTFEHKEDGVEIIDEPCDLEITQLENDGTIELAFTDRNERCYLKFRLQDAVAAVAYLHGEKP